ncbi:hypothetical protein, partial [Paraburkholderia caribensis]|uniref:hypothetical protein n=1 Tax=Paraburkholderia caribensis TaxID=75105 RepID=UPI003F4906A9
RVKRANVERMPAQRLKHQTTTREARKRIADASAKAKTPKASQTKKTLHRKENFATATLSACA